MAKRKKRKKKRKASETIDEAFRLAVLRQPFGKLKQLVQIFNLSTGTLAKNRKSYAYALAEANAPQKKLHALRHGLLSRMGSVCLYRIMEDDIKSTIVPDGGKAGATPKVFCVGKQNEIFDGMQHTAWAIEASEYHFIDLALHLQTGDTAAIIDAFYDPSAKAIQIRTNARTAAKIATQWAHKIGIKDIRRGMIPTGLVSRDEVEEFADLIDGHVVEVAGEKKIIEGFGEIRAKKHAQVDDLRGTSDYENLCAETTLIDAAISFRIKVGNIERDVKVLFGFGTRSLVFKNLPPEPAIRFVYDKLKEYFSM